MFNKLLIKIIKKFDYVKNLEINVEQLKAVETRLCEEKGDAVREKNRLAFDYINYSCNSTFKTTFVQFTFTALLVTKIFF